MLLNSTPRWKRGGIVAMLLVTMGLGMWWWMRSDDGVREVGPREAKAYPPKGMLVSDTLPSSRVDAGPTRVLSDRWANRPVISQWSSTEGRQVQRVRILRTDFKYPLVRVEESLETDSESKQEVLRAQVAMVADQVLVRVQGETQELRLAEFCQNQGYRLLKKGISSGVFIVQLPRSDVGAVPQALKQFGLPSAPEGVVEPNYFHYALALPNDPQFGQLWGLNNTGQTGGLADADIDGPEAWNQQAGAPGVLVGVIDTGIDQDHPDLIDNLWTNPHEIPGNLIDDDGNGYVDDIRGWDFVSEDNNPDDDNKHGTHCAGTIGAKGNNAIGVAGVCWTVKMVGLKFLNATGSGVTSDAVEAVSYATRIGVKLTSNSWGGGAYSALLESAIAEAGSAGILFVAAAGNSSSNNDSLPHYPSSYAPENIISVAASTPSDNLASFSSYGAVSVDLAAPGELIYSTVPGGTYASLSGTSMATPHVTGACALLWGAQPGLTAAQIKSLLISSVDAVPAFQTNTLARGRLNIANAIQLASGFYVSPSDGLLTHGARGGPFYPASKTFTVSNFSSSPVPWSASKSASWVDLSSTGGTLAPGFSAEVILALNASALGLDEGSYNDSLVFRNVSNGNESTRSLQLNIGLLDYFTELFDSTVNDTQNRTFTYTPDASRSFYRAQSKPATTFPTDPSGGISLVMSDDMYIAVTLADPNRVWFYGTSYSNFYVGSNGYITFGAGDSSLGESFGAHFAKPRIAALFDDLYPSTGQVTWKQFSDRVVVTFQNVAEYGSGGSNSFQIEMFVDGVIRVTVLGITVRDGLMGLSRGTGMPADFIESDMSAYPDMGTLTLLLPSSVAENAGLLTGQGRLSLSPPSSVNLSVVLASSDPGELSVPASIHVPAGQGTVEFDLTAVDDALLDGTRNVNLVATSANYREGTGQVAVTDNESAALGLVLPATVRESGSAGVGTVTVSPPPDEAVVVGLTVNNGELTVPATVVLPAGASSVNFTIQPVDDSRIDGTLTSVVEARVEGWGAASASLDVEDNETRNLSVVISGVVREGDAAQNIGRVSLSGTLAYGVLVQLISSATGEATVPANVAIPAGQSSVTFPITAVNDTLTDGRKVVRIDAIFSSFETGSATVEVLDNDVHSFRFDPITGSRQAGVAFAPGLGAHDINGELIVNYTGSAVLSAANSAGSAVVSPASTSAFTGGRWSGNVTVGTIGSATVLTATQGVASGSSNPFDVGTGPLHHFSWSAIPASLVVNTPHEVTLTAEDAGGNRLETYEGSVNFRAIQGGGSSDTVRILAFTLYSNDEYNKSLTAISRFFTNYTAVSTTVTDPAQLSTQLADKDVFLIVEQENSTSSQMSSLGTSWATVLGEFVARGGVVVACSWNTHEHLILQNAGLMDLTAFGAPSSTLVGPGSTATPINNGITAPFSGSFVRTFSATNGQISLKEESTGNPVVVSRAVGPGHVIMVGSDFYTTGTQMDRVLANAVQMASTGVALAMSPAQSGNFTGGVWTGELTVRETGEAVRFDARDPVAGVSTFTSAFRVDWRGGLALNMPTSVVEADEESLLMDVTIDRVSDTDLLIQLSVDQAGEITLPASVLIPAGMRTVSVLMSAVDNTLWDGNRVVRVNASAAEYAGASGEVQVIDNETATVTLSLPPFLAEGDGTLPTQGRLFAARAPDRDITFALVSSNPLELQVPSTVILRAGQMISEWFAITVMDDNRIDGNQEVTITANAGGSTATATLSVFDNEQRRLTTALPSQTLENAGILAGAGSVTTSGILNSPLIVTLTSSDPSRVTVPATVSIPANQNSAVFNVTVLDNSLPDGAHPVDISASASTFVGSSALLRVLDNDVHHLEFSAIPTAQIKGVTFPVTLTAKDVDGATLSSYQSTALLAASGDAGVLSLTPAQTGNFINGAWTGSLAILQPSDNVRVTVRESGGALGLSNAFTVSRGADIRVSPNPISVSLALDGSSTLPVLLENVGDRNLDWVLSIENASLSTSAGIPTDSTAADLTGYGPEGVLVPDPLTGRLMDVYAQRWADETKPTSSVLYPLNSPSLLPPLVYQVDWNQSPHVVGGVTAVGGTMAPSSVNFGAPTVVASFGPLNNRPLDLRGTNPGAELNYGQIGFNLDRTKQKYVLEFDLTKLDSDVLTVFFDAPTVLPFVFGTSTITCPGIGMAPVAYNPSALNHVQLICDLGTRTVQISLNGSPPVSGAMSGMPTEHRSIRFSSSDMGSPGGVAIDNVVISTETIIPPPAWLSVNTMSGSLAPENYQPLSLQVNAAGLSVGQHRANLRFRSNDPDNPEWVVPVNLWVTGAVDHFVIQPIEGTKEEGMPFAVVITAKDLSGNTVGSYNGTNLIQAWPDVADVPPLGMADTHVGPFIDGVWSGEVNVLEPGNAVSLLTTDDSGVHSGTSNVFAIRSAGSTLSGYRAWMDSYYPSTVGLWHLLADPDGDGLTNLEEFVFAGNPRAGFPSDRPTHHFAFVPGYDDGPYLHFVYRRRIGLTGVSQNIEVSSDLSNWSSRPENFEIVGLPVANPDGFTETLVVRVYPHVTDSSYPKRFVRLRLLLE